MDANFLSAFSSLPLRHTSDLKTALSRLLVGSYGDALTVKGTRDNFTTVNREAKAGRVRVVGIAPEDQTVILSVNDLATIIQAAAHTLTFADALSAAGFEPSGHDVTLPEGHEAENSFVFGEVDRDGAVIS